MKKSILQLFASCIYTGAVPQLDTSISFNHCIDALVLKI